MILVDKEIRNYKDIVVPFLEDSLQSESYDLHMGREIYILKNDTQIIDLKDNDILTNMYEEKTLDSFGYTMDPKEFILVSLKEKITLPEGINAHILPRTRFIRAGLYVSAQHINSTYSGRLRVGICNLQNRPLRIYPDLGICQVVFQRLSYVPTKDKLYENKKDAIYHKENDDFIGPYSEEIEKIVDDIINVK